MQLHDKGLNAEYEGGCVSELNTLLELDSPVKVCAISALLSTGHPRGSQVEPRNSLFQWQDVTHLPQLPSIEMRKR